MFKVIATEDQLIVFLPIKVGSTFDMKDIVCYLVGCVGLFLFESIRRTAKQRGKRKR